MIKSPLYASVLPILRCKLRNSYCPSTRRLSTTGFYAMYERRSDIVIPPTATLDERIRGLHYPGAMYCCEPEAMCTLAERRMRQLSSAIRAKSDWMETVKDAEMYAVWAAEAKAKELTDVEFRYVLDELAYYSSLHPLGRNVKLSAADGVWLSDSLIDLETTNELKEYAAILESTPSNQKDWHPDGESRMLNLIDPSLFPLIYARSKLYRQTCASPQAALNPGAPGEFPGSRDKWHEALSESGYCIPTIGQFHSRTVSDKFSWLPSEFRVDDNGAVTIESYINNLHPVKHAVFYPTIASIFAKCIPLLEQVVTDLVHPRQPRVVPNFEKYYESDEPMPEYDDDNDDDDYDYDDVTRQWKERATFVHPQPEPFVAPTRPASPYKLCGRRLQAIVRMSSIELTSKIPIYGGKDWSVAGLDNERIIATGIFFYDMANVSQGSLQFREALCAWDFMAEQFDVYSAAKAYGIGLNDATSEDHLISQEIGDVDIKNGRCVVFPSILQHKMPELELADRTTPGHCKMLTFYFVDPSTRIPSTEIVPPQQQEWYPEDALASEPFRSLPGLVANGTVNTIDFPISLKEAKQLRSQVPQDAGTDKDITLELFEPRFTVRHMS
ncbi:hypothetical protein GGF42_001808 [Coemansia sp. RSA 2424]|nr:hypothetical protein GGF42_001808 [Coemansia sp. RSA 2424]